MMPPRRLLGNIPRRVRRIADLGLRIADSNSLIRSLRSAVSRCPPQRMPMLAFGACFLIGGLAFLPRARPAPQPIAFNHAKHVASGLQCSDCHAGALTQARAGLPQLDICLMCHQAALTASPEEAKVRALAAAGQEAAWTQLTRLPAHVYFSHRRHAQQGNIACAVCHGQMEKLTSPPARPFRVFTMDACIECHQKNRARTDCDDCHR